MLANSIIILIFGLFTVIGFKKGVIKQVVLLLGLVIVLVVSFYLKNPVATFLYKNLPFFKFGGAFQGVTILNILLYEIIAFFLVFSVVYLILRVLLVISGIIEKLLRATIILGFFSRLAGGVVGFFESYIIIFIVLFFFSTPFINVTGINQSKLANKMLDETPVMSDAIKDTRKVINEVYELSKEYKNDSENFNKEAIELFLKYDIISQENVDLLKEKGKLN